MSQQSELYQQTILDHNRQPRNFFAMENATHMAEDDNPLCGDKIRVFLNIDEEINDISFQGVGCAICIASASVMTDELKGKTVSEAKDIFNTFQSIITGNQKTSPNDKVSKLNVFAGLSDFPARVKCAGLPWHVMRSAISSE